MYYIKKLGHQELGSVTEEKGPQRGRYLLVSKKAISDDFFPKLSVTQTNDNVIVPIISMELNKKVYCNFVYNNDKITKNLSNGRDEYRLYLNNDIENNKILFKEKDIVVFVRRDNIEESEFDSLYYMFRFSPENELYDFLDDIVLNSPIYGNHAIFEGEIPRLLEKIVTLDESATQTSISEQVIEQIETSKKDIKNLFTTNSFRDFVMVGYQSKCAITGENICFSELTNLEAAHIKPRAHGEINLPSNGIAMSRDMHWAFDKGFFTIEDDYTIRVHDEVLSEYLNKYNGKSIYVPSDDFFKPNKEFLDYHRTHIFGMFKFSGSIRRLQ